MTETEYKALSVKEFDAAAAKFDDNDPSIYNMCRKDYPDILAEVKTEPFTALLDAGCGTGAMLQMLCADVPGKQYTGIDLSEKMIEVAKRKNKMRFSLWWVIVRRCPLRRTALMSSPAP